ncbi:helix-turn-helix domain-containing protein, partial [Vibrio pectenicida]
MLLNFRDKIRLHIDGSGKSDSEIARKIGVSRVSVGRWKKDGRITRENLVKLCKILGVSERDFYSDDVSLEVPLKKLNII